MSLPQNYNNYKPNLPYEVINKVRSIVPKLDRLRDTGRKVKLPRKLKKLLKTIVTYKKPVLRIVDRGEKYGINILLFEKGTTPNLTLTK